MTELQDQVSEFISINWDDETITSGENSSFLQPADNMSSLVPPEKGSADLEVHFPHGTFDNDFGRRDSDQANSYGGSRDCHADSLPIAAATNSKNLFPNDRRRRRHSNSHRIISNNSSDSTKEDKNDYEEAAPTVSRTRSSGSGHQRKSSLTGSSRNSSSRSNRPASCERTKLHHASSRRRSSRGEGDTRSPDDNHRPHASCFVPENIISTATLPNPSGSGGKVCVVIYHVADEDIPSDSNPNVLETCTRPSRQSSLMEKQRSSLGGSTTSPRRVKSASQPSNQKISSSEGSHQKVTKPIIKTCTRSNSGSHQSQTSGTSTESSTVLISSTQRPLEQLSSDSRSPTRRVRRSTSTREHDKSISNKHAINPSDPYILK